MVDSGPVTENIVRDNEVDMLKFPVPIHHEDDGGRYIGTACGVVTRDPDTGRINVGTYRVQVKSGNTCASYISNGKQGRIHRDKYLKAGKPCPVVIIVGCDPITYLAAGYTMPDAMPEYEWAGGLMDRPMELVTGEVTGLPFPARAEIVLEGEISPTETTLEGPFGEWHGYYAGEAKDEPVIRIKRIYHRNDPILTCAASNKPPHSHLFERCFLRSAALLDALEGAGIPDVRGAWLHQAGAGRTFCVVSIKQRYHGHSTQVGLVASQVASVGYISRWIVVVDDDVDPTDIHDVIWAMGTRCDPEDAHDHARQLLVVAARHDGVRLFEAHQFAHGDRRLQALRALRHLPQGGDDLAGASRRRSAPNGRSSISDVLDEHVTPESREAARSRVYYVIARLMTGPRPAPGRSNRACPTATASPAKTARR